MKHTRLFAALAASAMLCAALNFPSAAETTYRIGDVNMDGEVSIEDAMLALKEYTYVKVAHFPHVLTEEQQKLADVIADHDELPGGRGSDPDKLSGVTCCDAQVIWIYYVECVANPKLKQTDIVEWAKNDFFSIVERLNPAED